jgi:hypothetical protein
VGAIRMLVRRSRRASLLRYLVPILCFATTGGGVRPVNSLAAQERPVWGDPWANSPWRPFPPTDYLRYRWYSGDGAGVWSTCAVQIVCKEGDQHVVNVQIDFLDKGGGLHTSQIPKAQIPYAVQVGGYPIGCGQIKSAEEY